jgi:hypothetical protein
MEAIVRKRRAGGERGTADLVVKSLADGPKVRLGTT